METVDQLLLRGAKTLAQAAERPRLEAELLLASILRKERTWLHAHGNDPVEPENYDTLLEQRAAHHPLEYLTGTASFYGRPFSVEPGVLIPRPETELLVEKVLELAAPYPAPSIAEIGVGSGAVAVTLALELPEAAITATDICPVPQKVAAQNARRFGVADRVTILESSLLDRAEGTFDIIVSNPPYIADDCPLPENVMNEPKEALFGGKRGDELLREIARTAIARKAEWLACEMGYDQKEPMETYLTELGYSRIAFYRDYAGLDRGFTARVPQ